MSKPAPAYPTARRVLTAEMTGRKRKRLLASIAAYLDEGHGPSVRELTARAKLRNAHTTMQLLGLLERDGLLRITRGQPGERNRYDVLI